MDLKRKFPNYSAAAQEAKNLAINDSIFVSIVNDNGEWVLRAANEVTKDDGLSFLGLDFGTSNCVASAFNDAGIQEFVKLDGVLPQIQTG
jgi:hypothetical protein